METTTRVPDELEVMGYLDSLSNWGRWGTDDQRGTLNLVTREVRRAAAALVTEGVSVSSALEIVNEQQPEDIFGPAQRLMLMSHRGPAGDREMEAFGTYVGFVPHGATITHLDALSHYSCDGRFYNGVPVETMHWATGATSHSVTAASDGVLTRGVLLDVAATRGAEWLEPGTPVFPSDLEAAEARQGVTVGEGDALLMRTGYAARRRTVGPTSMQAGYAGYHAACLPWFHARGVAIVGSDAGNDVVPSGYERLPLPLHTVGITALGLWLLDVCDLEALAAACRELDRSTFLFTLNPLRLAAGTGSPVNPVATF